MPGRSLKEIFINKPDNFSNKRFVTTVQQLLSDALSVWTIEADDNNIDKCVSI